MLLHQRIQWRIANNRNKLTFRCGHLNYQTVPMDIVGAVFILLHRRQFKKSVVKWKHFLYNVDKLQIYIYKRGVSNVYITTGSL